MHVISEEKQIIGEIVSHIVYLNKKTQMTEQFYLSIDRICFLLQSLHKNILCPTGCNLCCKENTLPELFLCEWEILISGLDELQNDTKLLIKSNVDKIFDVLRDQESINEANLYLSLECPLLINGKCSVYAFRPFKCRTHGYFFQEIVKNNLNGSLMFTPATCSVEKPRWYREVDFSKDKYQCIPLQSSFIPVLDAVNYYRGKEKSLIYYLFSYFNKANFTENI